MISALRLMLPKCCVQELSGPGLRVISCDRECLVEARAVVTSAGFDYVGTYWLPHLAECAVEHVLISGALLASTWFCDLAEYFEDRRPLRLSFDEVDQRLLARLAKDPEVRRAARVILELATRASEVRPALRGLAGPA